MNNYYNYDELWWTTTTRLPTTTTMTNDYCDDYDNVYDYIVSEIKHAADIYNSVQVALKL